MGFIFLTTPNLPNLFISFVRDIRLIKVSESPKIMFPAPVSHHASLYRAAEIFGYLLGGFEGIMLLMRFYYGSRISKKAETVGSLIFWIGCGYFAGLLRIQTIVWFDFLSYIIILIGVSIVARSLILLITTRRY